MKEFIVKTEMSEVKFNFPTKLEELSAEYLKEVTNSVIVAPNYSLIGLVYHDKLSNLILTCKNKKKNASFGVVPIFIKTSNGDHSIANIAKIGQKLLIANSQIQLSFQCSVPANKLTIDYFARTIDSCIDKDIYQKSLQDSDQREILFVEFKIIPNCDIIALYNESSNVENPYVTVSHISR